MLDFEQFEVVRKGKKNHTRLGNPLCANHRPRSSTPLLFPPVRFPWTLSLDLFLLRVSVFLFLRLAWAFDVGDLARLCRAAPHFNGFRYPSVPLRVRERPTLPRGGVRPLPSIL